jgi:fatty-acyl-CoA synthase
VLFVPTMSVAVVEEAARHRYDLSSLQSVFSAAAAAPVWLWQRIEKELEPRQVFTGYGQTEVSAATTLTVPGDPLDLVAETVGREKLGGVAAPADLDGALARYRTVDPFTGDPLPAGREGELSARGPIVTRGYYNDPERTAALIDSAGWLRSGDLGRVRDDGYLELTGRTSELFKVGASSSPPSRLSRCSPATRAWPRPTSRACPTSGWAKSATPGSSPRTTPRRARTSCCGTAAAAWPRSRYRARSRSSAPTSCRRRAPARCRNTC